MSGPTGDPTRNYSDPLITFRPPVGGELLTDRDVDLGQGTFLALRVSCPHFLFQLNGGVCVESPQP